MTNTEPMRPTDADLRSWHLTSLLSQYSDSAQALIEYAQYEEAGLLEPSDHARRTNEDAWVYAVQAEIERRING